MSLSPPAAFRELIESSAGIPDAAERNRVLRMLRQELTDLMGRTDRYLAQIELQQQAASNKLADKLAEARENADVRAELLRRGLATEEQLDDAGLWSHEQLDQLDSEGRLVEALVEGSLLRKAGRGLSGLAAKFEEKLHPRDREGKWRDKPKAAPQTPGVPTKSKFQERVEDLDQRAEKLAGEGVAQLAADQGTVPNDPGFGRTSQATLLEYVKEAATEPRTVELYSEVRDGPDGPERVYDASRKELHEEIIGSMLDGVPSQESPRVLFSGGGYAAGKGSVLKLMAARGDERLPKDALVIDPDKIKAMLPEFEQTLAEDPQANLRVYEEAWDIAQELQARAQEAQLNVIVDGISDTSPEEMLGRVRSFTEQGYSAHGFYVSIPTETATERAWNRAINAEDVADRRFIPKVIMRSVHRDVSATIPGVLEGAKDLNFTVDVYDNDVERGAEPIHVLTTENGEPKVLQGQDETWAQILAKGQERIPGVDAKRGRDAYGKIKKEGEA